MNTLIPATLVLSLSLAPAQSVEVPALPDNVIQLFKMEEDVSRHQLLLFTASWCPACVQMKNNEFPALRKQNWEISEAKSSHIRVIDVDQHADLTDKYNVQSLPTLILIVDGKEVSRSGSLNAYRIAEMFYNRK
ncbi:thioredoxin family protein [Gimesia maris]|uniref:Thioredoxin n=1 Tax=Gimesia maris TaxID=122 RepID=A0ABX5YPU2_9PLAN|nr:thioredoxin family protein [Gimesia maris]EDL56099.1 thioredoxin, putative [Gimesia maris DSM 8797]QEG17734.1 Thioredoxin [Gimesia maris]QGQ29225.1 thioredoxin family protein [Gimesia maris]